MDMKQTLYFGSVQNLSRQSNLTAQIEQVQDKCNCRNILTVSQCHFLPQEIQVWKVLAA
jgi:hypothetical protein